MNVVVDDTRFALLAEKFIIRFVASVVRTLKSDVMTSIDPNEPTEADISKIYSICFPLLGLLEDMGYIDLAGEHYFFYPAFADALPDPNNIFGEKGRIGIHGRLDDDLIRLGIAAAYK